MLSHFAERNPRSALGFRSETWASAPNALLLCMKNLESHNNRIGTALSLAIIAATVSVAHAGSQSNPVIRQFSLPVLQNLQNRQQRLNFQLQQQIYREQDSRTVERQQRLDVPVMTPRCPLQTSGTARTC